jgi:hypothetical protein
VKEIVLKKPAGKSIPKFGMLGKLSLNMDEDDEEVKVSKPPVKMGSLPKALGLSLTIDSDQNPRLAGTTGATNDDDDD